MLFLLKCMNDFLLLMCSWASWAVEWEGGECVVFGYDWIRHWGFDDWKGSKREQEAAEHLVEAMVKTMTRNAFDGWDVWLVAWLRSGLKWWEQRNFRLESEQRAGGWAQSENGSLCTIDWERRLLGNYPEGRLRLDGVGNGRPGLHTLKVNLWTAHILPSYLCCSGFNILSALSTGVVRAFQDLFFVCFSLLQPSFCIASWSHSFSTAGGLPLFSFAINTLFSRRPFIWA